MPEVLTSKGKAFLRHPWTGDVVEVPTDQVQDSLAAGMQALSDKEFRAHKEQTWRETPAMKLGAGLLAFERGLTGGLPDVAARVIGGTEGAEQVRLLKEANPGLSMGAEIGGTIAGVAATGLGSGAAQLGTKAAGMAARVGGGAATGTGARLAGTLAREAVLGGAMGLGGGVSEVALSPEELTLSEAARHLAAATGKGAAIGAGLGLAGWGAGTAARRVKARYSLNVGEIKSLRAERDALQAELKSAGASGATDAQLVGIQDQLAGVSTKLQGLQTRAIGKMLTRAAAYGIGHAVGGGVTGGLLGVVIAPRLIKSVTDVLSKHGGKVISSVVKKAGPTVERIEAVVEPYWSKAAPVVGEALQVPAVKAAVGRGAGAVSEAVGRGVGKVAGSGLGQMATEAVGHGLGTGIGAMAMGGADLVASGAMVGGIHGAAIAYGAHTLQRPISRALEIMTHKIAPAGQAAAVVGLSKLDLADLAGEIDHVDPTGLDMSLRTLLPESMPQPVKDAAASRIVTAMQVLQESAPGRPDQGRITSGATSKPSGEEMRRYKRTVAAVVQPESVVESFLSGRLRADQVQVWQRVYPEALEQLRAMVRAETAKAAMGGGKYSRQRASQIATLMGDQSLAPRMYDPKVVARMQQMHQQGGAEPPGPKPRPRPLDTASSHQTTMQRIRNG